MRAKRDGNLLRAIVERSHAATQNRTSGRSPRSANSAIVVTPRPSAQRPTVRGLELPWRAIPLERFEGGLYLLGKSGFREQRDCDVAG
jgi:hypothetical protein